MTFITRNKKERDQTINRDVPPYSKLMSRLITELEVCPTTWLSLPVYHQTLVGSFQVEFLPNSRPQHITPSHEREQNLTTYRSVEVITYSYCCSHCSLQRVQCCLSYTSKASIAPASRCWGIPAACCMWQRACCYLPITSKAHHSSSVGVATAVTWFVSYLGSWLAIPIFAKSPTMDYVAAYTKSGSLMWLELMLAVHKTCAVKFDCQIHMWLT